jgi:phage terminase Nu1 subunit (DNA packaging protein)
MKKIRVASSIMPVRNRTPRQSPKRRPDRSSPPPPAAAPAHVVTRRAEVAAHFGVSNRTVGYWQESGMPRGPGGVYDLDAIAAWLKESGVKRDSGSPERAELLKLDAEIKQMKLSRLRGELVEAEAVRRMLVRTITESKAILDQVPSRAAALLTGVPAKTRDRVRKGLVDIVRDVCDSLADMLAEPEDSSNIAASPRDATHRPAMPHCAPRRVASPRNASSSIRNPL